MTDTGTAVWEPWGGAPDPLQMEEAARPPRYRHVAAPIKIADQRKKMLVDMLGTALEYGRATARTEGLYADEYAVPREDIIPGADRWLQNESGFTYNELIELLEVGEMQDGIDWAWSITGAPTVQLDTGSNVLAFANPFSAVIDYGHAAWDLASGDVSGARDAWDNIGDRLYGYDPNPYGSQAANVLGVHNWQDAIWAGLDVIDLVSLGFGGEIIRPMRQAMAGIARRQGRPEAARAIERRLAEEFAERASRNELRTVWDNISTGEREVIEADYRAAHGIGSLDELEKAYEADSPLFDYYRDLADASGFTDEVAVGTEERYGLRRDPGELPRPYHIPHHKDREHFLNWLQFKTDNLHVDDSIHDLMRDIKEYAEAKLFAADPDPVDMMRWYEQQGPPGTPEYHASYASNPPPEGWVDPLDPETRARLDKQAETAERLGISEDDLDDYRRAWDADHPGEEAAGIYGETPGPPGTPEGRLERIEDALSAELGSDFDYYYNLAKVSGWTPPHNRTLDEWREVAEQQAREIDDYGGSGFGFQPDYYPAFQDIREWVAKEIDRLGGSPGQVAGTPEARPTHIENINSKTDEEIVQELKDVGALGHDTGGRIVYDPEDADRLWGPVDPATGRRVPEGFTDLKGNRHTFDQLSDATDAERAAARRDFTDPAIHGEHADSSSSRDYLAKSTGLRDLDPDYYGIPWDDVPIHEIERLVDIGELSTFRRNEFIVDRTSYDPVTGRHITSDEDAVHEALRNREGPPGYDPAADELPTSLFDDPPPVTAGDEAARAADDYWHKRAEAENLLASWEYRMQGVVDDVADPYGIMDYDPLPEEVREELLEAMTRNPDLSIEEFLEWRGVRYMTENADQKALVDEFTRRVVNDWAETPPEVQEELLLLYNQSRGESWKPLTDPTDEELLAIYRWAEEVGELERMWGDTWQRGGPERRASRPIQWPDYRTRTRDMPGGQPPPSVVPDDPPGRPPTPDEVDQVVRNEGGLTDAEIEREIGPGPGPGWKTADDIPASEAGGVWRTPDNVWGTATDEELLVWLQYAQGQRLGPSTVDSPRDHLANLWEDYARRELINRGYPTERLDNPWVELSWGLIGIDRHPSGAIFKDFEYDETLAVIREKLQRHYEDDWWPQQVSRNKTGMETMADPDLDIGIYGDRLPHFPPGRPVSDSGDYGTAMRVRFYSDQKLISYMEDRHWAAGRGQGAPGMTEEAKAGYRKLFKDEYARRRAIEAETGKPYDPGPRPPGHPSTWRLPEGE